MRPIKYRVWITPWGNAEPSAFMVYIPELHLHEYFGNWERGGYQNARFQQFTGIKDSSGKEIYEGDIIDVNTRFKKGMVKFENGGFIILGIPLQEYKTVSYPKRFSRLKVIGNIFENPELLK